MVGDIAWQARRRNEGEGRLTLAVPAEGGIQYPEPVERTYHVYILASGRNGTLYTGVTGSLAQRMHQHRTGLGDGFTQRYGVHRLVHLEPFADVREAIAREKAIKKWRRAWKLALIESGNPEWRDLYDDLLA